MNRAITACEEGLQTTPETVVPAVNEMGEDLLEQDYYFALSCARRHVSRLYNRRLAGASATVGQFDILLVLREHGLLTMAGLGAVLVMDRTSLMRAIKPLVSAGLVEQSRHAYDGLRYIFTLTAAGVERTKQCETYVMPARLDLEKVYGSSNAMRLRKELFSLTR
ncbi:DNA-binding transcriptional regulator, MarR family [Burkholderia sp. D7]|nr:DNA-binding transcriptional regulator, MarR family [Burkholderia sp. D7]